MPFNMTQASDHEYSNILYGHMTPAMAASYLRDGNISIRSFSETLRGMYLDDDLSRKLFDFFLNAEPESNPQSVLRRVRNWLSGKNQPSSREDLFRIAFALGLSETQLNHLLCLCTDYGIQYRDSRDAVMTWFLRHSKSYQEALSFLNSLPKAPGFETGESLTLSRLTHELRDEFQMVHDTDELRSCYLQNISLFGSLHLRAYYYFEQYLDQLIHPQPAWDEETEQDYSVETIMDLYLTMKMPSGKDRSDYSLIQKLLKQNWPNATSLKNIRLHKKDVPRKLLLLLYVVTENIGVMDDMYHETDEDYMTMEERVEDHWWTLNAMLNDCGMASLDLRNATDWLILYAICADPDGEPMSDRLQQVISHMFEPQDADPSVP